MSYLDEAFLPHLRLAMLRVLAVAPGFSANSSILHQSVCDLGLNATRDQVRGELAWLADARLATTKEPMVGLIVATLSERGLEVQQGLSSYPGVQRPSPRA